jgi:hypothetical protein
MKPKPSKEEQPVKPTRFYGFQYDYGRDTTTGDSQRGTLHIAGSLWWFSTAEARDAWVAEGYRHPVPMDIGNFRGAVDEDDLPLGWRAESASWGEAPPYTGPGLREEP